VSIVKEGIHPKYTNTKVTCVCGETFETGSTRKELRVEICSKCHPFYTGSQRTIDTGGRAEKFRKKYGLTK
jgi:large subunit ribosomal protein L31